MAELPVLPIITAALIADTVHMTAEQFGAYVRILLAMWGHGAELRDDDNKLARIAGLTPRRWQAIREVVLGPVHSADGVLHQKRLSKTWDEVQKLRVKRSIAANEKWKRERLRDAHAYAKAMQNACKTPAKPMQNSQLRDAHAMQLKLKDKTTTTFVGTAREGLPREVVEISQTSLPADPPGASQNEGLAAPASVRSLPESGADQSPGTVAEHAREAVQKSTGIGSGELVATMQAKGWVKP